MKLRWFEQPLQKKAVEATQEELFMEKLMADQNILYYEKDGMIC